MTYCKKRLLGHFTQKLSRCWVHLGLFFGRFGVDLGSIWDWFSVLGGSWAVLGRSWGGLGSSWGILGRPSGGFGRPRSIFNRFWVDLEAHLGTPNRRKSIKNRCQDAFKFCIGFHIDCWSIFDRFGGPFGLHFGVMLGIIWRIGDIAKNVENTIVL